MYTVLLLLVAPGEGWRGPQQGPCDAAAAAGATDMGEKRPTDAESAMAAKKRRRAERDKARAEAFHAKRKRAEEDPVDTAAASAPGGEAIPSSGVVADGSASKVQRRAERDARRAEAFHAKKQAAEAAASNAPAAAGVSPRADAEAPAAPPVDTESPLTNVDKRSERDRRRAEAFHAKKQAAAEAAATSTGAAESRETVSPVDADVQQQKKKPMSERDKRRAEAFAAKQKLLHAPKNSKGELAKPLWETHQWTRVFVANLAFDATEDQARQWFSNGTRQHGEIERISWLKDPATRTFKGCGFVHFTTAAAAKAAVDMNGSSLNGRKVKVAWQKDNPNKKENGNATAPGESGGLDEKPEGCVTIHLGNLDYATTEADMRAWASEHCGTVRIVKLLRNKKTQQSTGCGFVAFQDPDGDEADGTSPTGLSAEAAVDKAIALGKAGTAVISGREIRVKYALKPPRPTYRTEDGEEPLRPGQAARLGKGVTPSTAALAAAAAAAGKRLAAAGASAGAGGSLGAGALATKLLQRKLEAERWNSSGQAALAASETQPSSGGHSTAAPAARATTAAAATAAAGGALSKAEKRAARDQKRAEAFRARQLAQEQQQ